LFTPINSIEGKKQIVQLYRLQINEIDKDLSNNLSSEVLKKRNELVNKLFEAEREIPLEFSKGDSVVVLLKRRILGRVLEIADKTYKHYLIKPIDHIYTTEIIVPECLLKPNIEDGGFTHELR
jgi:hypothetical protein